VATRALEPMANSERFGSILPLYVLSVALYVADNSADVAALLRSTIAANAGRPDPFSRQRVRWATMALGVFHLQVGDLPECRMIVDELRSSSVAQRYGRNAAQADYLLGVTSYERDRLAEAIKHFSAVVAQPQAGVVVQVESTIALALALEAAGRADAADATLARLIDRFRGLDNTAFLPTVRACQARLALGRGDLGPALRWLRSTPISAHEATLRGGEVPALTRVKVLLAEGSASSLAAAERDLDELERRVDAWHLTRRTIEVLALRALLHRARGRTEEALATLSRSLGLAERGGFVRTIVDLGPEMRHLLRELAEWEDVTSHLDRVLAAFPDHLRDPEAAATRPVGRRRAAAPTPATVPIEALPERLTDRELEVLAGLERRLSNKEIAEELAISPQTVKRHASNIYGKLGVNSRRQAIRHAAAIGLPGAA
jgi:LuxR family maltose regulon positive regulatory protein